MHDGLRHFLSLVAVVAAIAVPLAVAGLNADEAQPRADRLSAGEVAAMVPQVANGVEAIRGLRFRHPTPVRIVTPAQLRRIYERELERQDSHQDLESQSEVLEMLGLLQPGEDLLDIAADSVELVAGAYDPRTGRLVVVDSEGLTAPAIVEFILAHELEHALEDQRFGLRRLDHFRDDRLLASEALAEGSATYLMTEYAIEFQDLTDLLDASLDPALAESASSAGLPDFVRAQLSFPYLRGQEFVRELVDLGGDWDLVDIAYRERLPLSTEQVLHPRKYLAYERPVQPDLDMGAQLGPGWKRLTAGELGEFDTIQLLRSGAPDALARRAAAGWGGGRYALWRREGAGCDDDPCRSGQALALAWRWDSAADAREFEPALRRYLRSGLEAVRRGGGWKAGGSTIEVRSARLTTTLLFAPTHAADR